MTSCQKKKKENSFAKVQHCPCHVVGRGRFGWGGGHFSLGAGKARQIGGHSPVNHQASRRLQSCGQLMLLQLHL